MGKRTEETSAKPATAGDYVTGDVDDNGNETKGGETVHETKVTEEEPDEDD